MRTFNSIQSDIRSTATATTLGLVLAASGGIALAGGNGAEKVEATFPLFFSEPITCPGHYLDGIPVSALVAVKGVAHSDGFLTPWLDGAGGEHLKQIAKLKIDAWSDDQNFQWRGTGRGKFSYNGGGPNEGGVVVQYQQEYYHAQGDFPDLQFETNFVLVADANGNVRVMTSEGTAGLECVQD